MTIHLLLQMSPLPSQPSSCSPCHSEARGGDSRLMAHWVLCWVPQEQAPLSAAGVGLGKRVGIFQELSPAPYQHPISCLEIQQEMGRTRTSGKRAGARGLHSVLPLRAAVTLGLAM